MAEYDNKFLKIKKHYVRVILQYLARKDILERRALYTFYISFKV